MKIIKNIIYLIIVLIAAYLFSETTGLQYEKLFPGATTSFLDFTAVVGLPLAYVFFLTSLFTAFGDSKKYWWIGVLLIPAAAFELYFDWQHIYIPIALGLVGWVIGFGISKLMPKAKV